MSEKIDKYLDLVKEMEKQFNIKVKVISIVVWNFEKVSQKTGKETGGHGIQRLYQDYSDYSIVKVK